MDDTITDGVQPPAASAAYTLALHDALPICPAKGELRQAEEAFAEVEALKRPDGPLNRARVYLREGRLDEATDALRRARSEEHTSELQSPCNLVCRLLLEKKKRIVIGN